MEPRKELYLRAPVGPDRGHVEKPHTPFVKQHVRKIIQISTSTSLNNDFGLNYTVALCDDGTLWELGTHHGWQKLAAIPQDEAQS